MRWLLDQGLPRTAAALLREVGLDAVHVGEILMATSKDHEILQLALNESRVSVTFDADFHAMLAISGASKPSIIRIREEGLKASAVFQLIIRLQKQFTEALEKGCLLTATLTQARLRLLPINS
jgi:predicted nuclease of predicted toxin-antitoxin system